MQIRQPKRRRREGMLLQPLHLLHVVQHQRQIERLRQRDVLRLKQPLQHQDRTGPAGITQCLRRFEFDQGQAGDGRLILQCR